VLRLRFGLWFWRWFRFWRWLGHVHELRYRHRRRHRLWLGHDCDRLGHGFRLELWLGFQVRLHGCLDLGHDRLGVNL